ncbi:MAG TPA: endonuclease III [archaeon]|nr:endonuclease III [archaeon]
MLVKLADRAATAQGLVILKKAYPDATYYLNFSTLLQLLVAVVLSAQCRDEAVNACTAQLFKRYRTAQDFAELKDSDISSITFSKNKAANIRAAMEQLISRYNGQVPQTMEELTALPGIGRKSANVILANGFHKVVGIPVDTHVIRLSQRLGWTRQRDPEKIEKDLQALFPKSEWEQLPHLLKSHGRALCKAPVPICSRCPLAQLCPRNGVTKSL